MDLSMPAGTPAPPPRRPAAGRPDPLESAPRSAFDQGEPVEDDEPLVLAADPDAPVPYTVTADDTAAKDSHPAASTLSSDVLDLLAAIRDAVDVPLSGLDEDDEDQHRAVMRRRLSEVHIALDVALAPEFVDTLDPAREAATIRKGTAAVPITYTVWEKPERDGGAR